MGGVVDSVFGGGDDASDAAGIQAQATRDAAELQRKTAKEIREDLKPFREAGATDLDGLASLVTDPEAQKDFITNNPFFDALAEKSTDTLLNNQAAKGKVGSGGTAEALQNSLLLLGNDLLNQNITQRQNLANFGAGAAAQTGQFAQQSANAISDLTVQGANAQAAGIIGDANAKTEATQNLISTGLQAAFLLCDMRAKRNVEQIGMHPSGLPLYRFQYLDNEDWHESVMAQDVEKIFPDAVEEIDGYKYVNMEKITWQ